MNPETVGRTLTVAEAAYIAAMVDGEGHITIRSIDRPDKRRGRTLAPKVAISNTDRGLIDRLYALTGGRIDTLPGGERRRESHQVVLGAWQVRNILPQIRPYMVSKTRLADLMLEYFALQDRGRLTGLAGVLDEDWPRALEIADEMRLLNDRWRKLEGTALKSGAEERRPCSVAECDRKAYRAQEWCYRHWLKLGDHPRALCETCGRQMTVIREGKQFCSAECSRRTNRDVTPRREYRKLTDDKVRQIVAAFHAGDRCLTSLAARFGSKRETVRLLLLGQTWRHLNLDLPDPALIGAVTGENHWTTRQQHPQKGERHHRKGGKLTEQQVRDIRRRYAAGGVTQKQLAEEFGVAILAIGHVIARKTWAHLADE